MHKWKLLVLLLVGALLYLPVALFLPSTVSAQVVTVSIDAPAEVDAGTSFIARVSINDVPNFDACNYDVTYDPTVLEVTDVTAGMVDGTTIPVDIWGEITPGRIRVIENIPEVPGVSGSGYLAEIHFHVVGEYCDISDIALSNGVLSDNTATEIPATWLQDLVHVTAPTTTGVLAPPAPYTLGPAPPTGSDAIVSAPR